MRRLLFLVLCLTLAACDERAAPLSAYRHPEDAMASVLPLGLAGVYPCASRQKEDGIDVVARLATDQCYKMQPARRFRGVWIDEFEGSTFYEGMKNAETVKAKILRDVNTKTSRFEWLSWPDSMAPAPSPRSRIVLLDFIGRRTAYQGRYGHMGLADSEVIVDRLISAREIYRSSTPYLEDELLERKR